MVIVTGVQFYQGKEHRYIAYPVMDVLQMMGRACRLMEDERSPCVLMRQQTRMDFYKKFLTEGLPIESHLPTHLLHDYFLAKIAVKTIKNKQDAMVSAYDSCLCFLIVFTFYLSGYSDLDLLYRRITQSIPKPLQYAQCQPSATIRPSFRGC